MSRLFYLVFRKKSPFHPPYKKSPYLPPFSKGEDRGIITSLFILTNVASTMVSTSPVFYRGFVKQTTPCLTSKADEFVVHSSFYSDVCVMDVWANAGLNLRATAMKDS